jgi:hypothetical protein
MQSNPFQIHPPIPLRSVFILRTSANPEAQEWEL